SDHGIVAVAEERLVQELHVLADRPRRHVLGEAFLRRLERTELDVGEALHLQVELEEIRWDRPQVLRIVPERVRADRKGPRVRGDENDGRAGRQRAAACPKYFDELTGKDTECRFAATSRSRHSFHSRSSRSSRAPKRGAIWPS